MLIVFFVLRGADITIHRGKNYTIKDNEIVRMRNLLVNVENYQIELNVIVLINKFWNFL